MLFTFSSFGKASNTICFSEIHVSSDETRILYMVERGKRKVCNRFYAIIRYVVCANINDEGEKE